MKFTGEFLVPGEAGERIEQDHLCRYEFAARHVAGKHVLDVACGIGYASEILIAGGALSYCGIDINPELVDYAQHRYGDGGSARFETGDITGLTFENEFDVVVSFETIEHVARYEKALGRLFAALRPGGTQLVSSPNRPATSPRARDLTDPPDNRFHTQEFTVPELTHVLTKAGFAIGPGDVFGQRQHLWPYWKVRGKIARTLGLSWAGPEDRTSPQVMPLSWKRPRYFVIVARKPAALS